MTASVVQDWRARTDADERHILHLPDGRSIAASSILRVAIAEALDLSLTGAAGPRSCRIARRVRLTLRGPASPEDAGLSFRYPLASEHVVLCFEDVDAVYKAAIKVRFLWALAQGGESKAENSCAEPPLGEEVVALLGEPLPLPLREHVDACLACQLKQTAFDLLDSNRAAYTLGVEANYDEGLRTSAADGKPMHKTGKGDQGRDPTYAGGSVWRDPDGARAWADKASARYGKPYAVYELHLPATWGECVYMAPNGHWSLLVDARIVGKVARP